MVVYKFRLLKLGQKILNSFKENAELEKIEKEKRTYKDQMWSKVNKWLVDIDKKSPNSTNEEKQTLAST